MNRCLILNASYEPLDIVSWRRALGLLLAERADLLDAHPELKIGSASADWPLPLAVRLRSQIKRPFRAQMPFSRRHLMARDGWSCQYCGARSVKLNIDHIVPRSRGGRTSWDNCVAACHGCNGRKRDRTPDEAGMILRRAPFAPRWHLLVGQESNPAIEIWSKWAPVS